MFEPEFIESLRHMATHPAARSFLDDAAVLEVGGATIVLTHDVLAEGVHFLPQDPPADVAWKLLAVNLSDLAAKGARPLGVLLGFALGDEAWDRAFLKGLGTALSAFDVPLLGGDTVAAPRVLGLTALGEAAHPVPSRSGARPGDELWATGTIGDAGAGLRCLKGELPSDEFLIERYRRPRPRLDAGRTLVPLVSAMMDVSDGLLIDASRIAGASGVALSIELGDLPLSAAYRQVTGDDASARIAAASAGDDYELLFSAPRERAGEVRTAGETLGLRLSRIGYVSAGDGLHLRHAGQPLPLPFRLGWQHGEVSPGS